jgi:hypothetical protein
MRATRPGYRRRGADGLRVADRAQHRAQRGHGNPVPHSQSVIQRTAKPYPGIGAWVISWARKAHTSNLRAAQAPRRLARIGCRPPIVFCRRQRGPLEPALGLPGLVLLPGPAVREALLRAVPWSRRSLQRVAGGQGRQHAHRRRYARLGVKIKWPGTGADGGVLRAWGSLSMSPAGPDALDSSWRMAAVSLSASGTWAGPDSTMSRSVPA